MSVKISRSLLGRLRVIAARDPTHEMCGLLLGRDDAVDAIVEARNVAANPRMSFEIDARVQIGAMKAARMGGPAVIGCYHSHPSGAAMPSQRDLDMAEVGAVWLIFAGNDVTAWQRGAADFQQLALDVR